MFAYTMAQDLNIMIWIGVVLVVVLIIFILERMGGSSKEAPPSSKELINELVAKVVRANSRKSLLKATVIRSGDVQNSDCLTISVSAYDPQLGNSLFYLGELSENQGPFADRSDFAAATRQGMERANQLANDLKLALEEKGLVADIELATSIGDGGGGY